VFRFVVALMIVLVSGCTCYDKKSDLSYDKMNVPFGVFDYYKPICDCSEESALRPSVVLIHGGAWMGGNKSDMEKVAAELTKHGYACFAPNYRLTSDGPWGKGSPWPAQFEDLKKFLVYLQANSGSFGVDRDKIASLGISAGGHLAQMLHLRDPVVHTKTACDLDGETDLRPPGNVVMSDYGDIMELAGGVAGVNSISWMLPARRNAAQQAVCLDISHVFIIHGEEDSNIYVDQADRLAIALKNAGADYDYVRLPGKRGACHGNCWQDDKAMVHLLHWLDTHLK